MKKIYSTFHGLILMIALITLVPFTQSANAQCSLACVGDIQISLDANCEAEVTYDMVLNADQTSCPGGAFIVELRDQTGTLLPTSPFVTSDHIGQVIEVKAIDTNSGNSCWSNATIEDKTAPTIDCSDVTIDCWEVPSYLATAIDNCSGATTTEVGGTETPLDCDPDYILEMTRTFIAIDASGNESEPCTQNILVNRFNPDSINLPDNFTMALGNPLQCDVDYELDDNGNPHPNETGVPTIGAINKVLWPATDLSCNVFTTYTDVRFPAIGGVTKIMRTWVISEWWCDTSIPYEYLQLIEIVDNVGPDFTCPQDLTVSTTPGADCNAIVLLPSIEAVDNCSDDIRVDITYPGGFIQDSNGFAVELPIGDNQPVTYTVYDEHLNRTECTFYVTVNDDTAPNMVCTQFTVVSLGYDGTGLVYAESFDSGSYDDCSDVTLTVKRMDNGGECGYDNQFDESVLFCCADLDPVMVILRAEDASGNVNTCMVEVQVQDKLAPTISCPQDITIACDSTYDINNMDNWGVAEAYDNCSVSVVENTPYVNINKCGEGFIYRSWTATSGNSSVSSTCGQFINFVNDDPFDGNDPNQLSWPTDVSITDCVDPNTISPEETGEPVITEGACDLVGVSHTDKIFDLVKGDNACSKIIRTWTVIDCCQSDADGNFLEWTHQQVILIINTDGPEFTGDYTDKTVCTYDLTCSGGYIDLTAEATDLCTSTLSWKASIDLFDDGTFDQITPLSQGTSVDASGTYPIGTHKVVYTAEDGCGNATSQVQYFTIANCKKPTPVCYNGLAIDLMPIDTDNDGDADTGMIEVVANDFNKDSYHPCGYDLVISFSADVLDTVRTFTCDELGDNELDIWATAVLPDGTLLQDYCTASLNVQDNNDVCDGNTVNNNLVYVKGKIADENNEPYSEVSVKLEGGDMYDMTADDGVYSFNNMATGGDYNVIPKKEIDYLNGVTTTDIVMIQKHIMKLELLDSPYKIIAADINKDNKVTGTDIIILRKLLLASYENDVLPMNSSWRFVDKAYNFSNEQNPLQENFPESYSINDLDQNMNIDFVAAKIGDVNNSAKANANSDNTEIRTNQTFTLNASNKTFEKGDIVTLDVTAENIVEILGFQFTTEFNNDLLSYNGIQAGALNISEAMNFGVTRVESGILTASWNTIESLDIQENAVLFSINFTALQDGELYDNVELSSTYTTAAAFTMNYEEMDIELDIRNDNVATVANSYELYQNVPNPFTSNTTVSFLLPADQQVEIAILDISGKMIHNVKGDYNKGLNNVEIDLSALNVSGVLYYQLKADEYTATRKMVILK